MLSKAAMIDIAHLLRPAHLQQLANILKDPEASKNDRFVALELLKNANIAAAMILPGYCLLFHQLTARLSRHGNRHRYGQEGAVRLDGRRGREGAVTWYLRGVHQGQSALFAGRPCSMNPGMSLRHNCVEELISSRLLHWTCSRNETPEPICLRRLSCTPPREATTTSWCVLWPSSFSSLLVHCERRRLCQQDLPLSAN